VNCEEARSGGIRIKIMVIYRSFKRTFDVIASLSGLIVLSPVLVFVAMLIKLEDGGPIFYRGRRAGLNGKEFRIFKFRTMVVNAEKIGGVSTADDDPRITKIGQFMRKYKIDELPQLIDVLRGVMSIVGPRPEVPSEVATYGLGEKKVLAVRPGITDWASVEYHNEGEILKGEADPHKAYREKIRPGKLRLQMKYVNEMSFMTDMRILITTVMTLVRTRVNSN
jgi:lipopolysaccharide/colanic/teichoic acid biosynthesis glycosyltransferase